MHEALDLTTRSLRLSISEVVAELVKVLGTPIVATVGGGKTTRAVRGWMRNENSPRNDQALRSALQIVDVLRTADQQDDTIRAWFGGMNPLLDDDNPALILGRNPHNAKRVLHAARRFAAQG